MPKPEQVGALWRRHSAKAGEYFTGLIDGKAVIVFVNAYKRGHKNRPDLIVYRSVRQPGKEGG